MTRDSFRLDEEGNLRSELLEQFPWLQHGFGTRIGQLPPFPLATVKQIHSAEVLDAGCEPGLQGEADALITACPGLAVGVKTADCVPILLVDSAHYVVAAIHAGWRGTVKEIAALAVRRMIESYKTIPSGMYAAVGPAIGACCYEVGPEVGRQFSKWDESLASASAPMQLGLEEINTKQLILAGIPLNQIAQAHACTKCNVDTFFSFRMEGDRAGRMMSWIATR